MDNDFLKTVKEAYDSFKKSLADLQEKIGKKYNDFVSQAKESFAKIRNSLVSFFADPVQENKTASEDKADSSFSSETQQKPADSEFGRASENKTEGANESPAEKKANEAALSHKSEGRFYKIDVFLRHILDLITDMILIFGSLTFVKPSLLKEDFLRFVTFGFAGGNLSFFYYPKSIDLSNEIIFRRNFIFVACVALFFALKTIISLSCEKNRKSVTLLLFVMLAADFLLIMDKFFVFAIFLFLILLTLQFSMGFSKKTVKIKAVFFVLACLTGYFLIHLALFEDFSSIFYDFLSKMKETMSLPVKWW